ncbi:CYFA0S07e00276g1_1 [Cyberlindnera fabianii]|uniref:CYFA0S07e00276g1_1 n=2 Tax=Cyberlindnera fabianii TaxID=36022 RepID=A0A061B2P0_CYBFA|nr:CYFA0S07e00276g1_1 [Cyberlindnera fabianii]
MWFLSLFRISSIRSTSSVSSPARTKVDPSRHELNLSLTQQSTRSRQRTTTMISFLTELWESIFTPGTTPTLVLATHATFALLVVTLTVFAFLTKSIHIINLLVLSLVLWGILTWFINEINTLNSEKQSENTETKITETKATTKSAAKKPTSVNTTKKRKV